MNVRYISRYQLVSADLIRLRNLSKLVEGTLFAITDLLLEAKSIVLNFMWRWGGGGVFSLQKNSCFITFNFFMLLLLHRP